MSEARAIQRTARQSPYKMRIIIDRKPGKVVVTLHTGRPGVVIGKKGEEVGKLKSELQQITGKDVGINVEEIKRPEIEAQLVADNIAAQLAQRILSLIHISETT